MRYLFKLEGSKWIITNVKDSVVAEFEFLLQPIIHPRSKDIYAFELITIINYNIGENHSERDFFDLANDEILENLIYHQILFSEINVTNKNTKILIKFPCCYLINFDVNKIITKRLNNKYIIELDNVEVPSDDCNIFDILNKYKSHGIGFCLSYSDFDNYSNYSLLSSFSWDCVKLSKEFLYFIGNEIKFSPFIGVLREYCSNIILDGVETRFQRDYSIYNNTLVRGYFYSPPLKVSEVNEFISR